MYYLLFCDKYVRTEFRDQTISELFHVFRKFVIYSFLKYPIELRVMKYKGFFLVIN